jgi:hypothetical protein
MVPWVYVGASSDLKIWLPAMLPTQYPMKVAEEMMVFLVRPATLLGTWVGLVLLDVGGWWAAYLMSMLGTEQGRRGR